MPGMTSTPRKGRRDFEPASCLNETGVDCERVPAQEFALGWAATVMSPVGSSPTGSWPARIITDEPCERIVHARVCGGRREQSRPLPGSGRGDCVSVNSLPSGPPPLSSGVRWRAYYEPYQ